MKLQRIIATTVALIATAATVMADDNSILPPFTLLNRQPTAYSPQSEEMIRYDHADVNLNTGCLQQRIPLVDIQDKDFDFPLSLIYAGAGFRPQNSDNFVGRDWMLEAGGVIYRTVNGMPDDLEGFRPHPDATTDQYTGFLAMLGKKYFNLSQMKEEVSENPYKYAHLRSVVDSSLPTIPSTDRKENIECSPDVFRFSFGKHSGKFMINYDGSISVVGYDGKKYEVDLSAMKMFSDTYAQDTRIRIKTDDGYVYTFGGGGYSSLEYTALSWKGRYFSNFDAKKSHNEISAYYLTSITAPNGRTLTIHYKDIKRSYHERPDDLGSSQLDLNQTEEKKELSMQYILSGKRAVIYDVFAISNVPDIRENKAFGSSSSSNAYDRYSFIKLALIDYITTDQGTVQFKYSLRDQHVNFDGIQPSGFFTQCGAKLDEITMHMGNRCQSAHLSYKYDLGNRMFLNSIRTDLEGTHRFEYFLPYLSNAPTPLTCNIDHWGFWRGVNKEAALIPSIKQDSSSSEDFTITSDHRDATGQQYDVSMLKSIDYPTGGHAEFTYEPHRYSRMPRYTTSSMFYPSIGSPFSGQYGLAGGGRIHSVRFTDSDGKTLKESIYTYGQLLSEGTITYMPFYKLICVQKNLKTGIFEVRAVAYNSEGFEHKTNPGAHIRYPSVTQHYIDPNKGGLEQKHPYKMTDYIGINPGFLYTYANNSYFRTLNVVEGSGMPLSEYYTLSPKSYQIYTQHLTAHPTIDLFLYHGKIQQEQYFDENRHSKKHVVYQYQYINNDLYSPCIFLPNANSRLSLCDFIHIGRESFSNLLLSGKIVYTCEQEEKINAKVEKELYEYDEYGYPLRLISIKNDVDSLIIENNYCELPTSLGFQILPETRKSYRATSMGRKWLSTDHIEYKFPITTHTDSLQWYAPTCTTHYTGNNEAGDRMEYKFYDSYGNPLVTLKNNSQSTVYLYGHKGQYLMAKLENASYEEVSAALGMNPESLSDMDDPSSIILLLRQRLYQANVYTYTYNKVVPLISETSPDGKTIHYQLDSRGRLLQAYRTGENGESESLLWNEYHLVNK